MCGFAHAKGSVEVGKDADLVLLDKSFKVRLTVCQGSVIYDAAG